MKHKITNELDFLVAKAQKETDFAREVLLRTRQEGDYWKEKAAAKLLAFLEQEEKLFSLYAEAKIHFPMLAEMLEKKSPYLVRIHADAKRSFEEHERK